MRFPVALQNAAEIDDRVMRELYAAVEQDPKLQLVGTGMPTLRTDLSTPTPVVGQSNLDNPGKTPRPSINPP